MGFERAVLAFLKEFTPRDLEYAVSKNMSIADYAKDYAKIFKVYANYVSPQNLDKAVILNWIMGVNPELAHALKTNSNNYSWFCKQIDEATKLTGGNGHGQARSTS